MKSVKSDTLVDFIFSRVLQLEEEYIQKVCSEIIAVKPDVIFTEKGVSGTVNIANYPSVFSSLFAVFIVIDLLCTVDIWHVVVGGIDSSFVVNEDLGDASSHKIEVFIPVESYM